MASDPQHQPQRLPPLLPPDRLVQHDHRQHHHRRFLGKHSDRGDRRQRRPDTPSAASPSAPVLFKYSSRPPSTPIPASRSARPTMLVTDSVSTGCTAHSAAVHAAGRHPASRRPSAYTSSTLTACSSEVDPVVAGGVLAVAQSRVVEQVRKRGQRPEQPALPVRPPVGVPEDEVEILRRGRADPRILQNQPAIVHRESRAERVGIHRQRQQAKSHPHQNMAPPLRYRRGGALRLPRFHETSA